MEVFGIEAGKDPPKGVMRGDAIGQVEQLLQPPLFAFAKEFHVLESVATDHDGPQSNDDDVDEAMLLGAFDSRVWQVFEVGNDRYVGHALHGLGSSDESFVLRNLS